jgi:N-acetyl-beta-hexosaminidase
MIATFDVEKLDEKNQTWSHAFYVSMDVPFASLKKWNTIMDIVPLVADSLAKLHIDSGTFRVGGDEAAQITWNGVSPHLLATVADLPTRTRRDLEIERAEAEERLKTRN